MLKRQIRRLDFLSRRKRFLKCVRETHHIQECYLQLLVFLWFDGMHTQSFAALCVVHLVFGYLISKKSLTSKNYIDIFRMHYT